MRFNILLLVFCLVVGTAFVAGGYVWGYMIGSLLTLPFALAAAVYKALGHFKGTETKRVYAFWGTTLMSAHFAVNAKIGFTVGVAGFGFLMGAFAIMAAFWAINHARKMTSFTDSTKTKV